MRVGALEETITVTGEAPIVDVQSTTRQRVMDQEIIGTLPTGRNMFKLGVLIPGISISHRRPGVQDVGGALGPETRALVAHGGRTEDQRFMMNGVSLSSMIGGGWGGGAIPNATGVQEMVFDTASVNAELATGGVRINFIAREGGNQYHGSLFGNFANDSYADDQHRRRAAGAQPAAGQRRHGRQELGLQPRLRRTNQAGQDLVLCQRPLSGCIPVRARHVLQRQREQPGTSGPTCRTPNRPASLEKTWLDAQLRSRSRCSQKNKIGLTYTQQDFCACHDTISATTAPEAALGSSVPDTARDAARLDVARHEQVC